MRVLVFDGGFVSFKRGEVFACRWEEIESAAFDFDPVIVGLDGGESARLIQSYSAAAHVWSMASAFTDQCFSASTSPARHRGASTLM